LAKRTRPGRVQKGIMGYLQLHKIISKIKSQTELSKSENDFCIEYYTRLSENLSDNELREYFYAIIPEPHKSRNSFFAYYKKQAYKNKYYHNIDTNSIEKDTTGVITTKLEIIKPKENFEEISIQHNTPPPIAKSTDSTYPESVRSSFTEIKTIPSVSNQLNTVNDQPFIELPKIKDNLLSKFRKLLLLFIVIVGGCYMVAYVLLGYLTAIAALFVGIVVSGIVWILFEPLRYNKKTRSDEWVSDFDSRMNKLSLRLEQKQKRWRVILLLLLGFSLYSLIALVISHL
jgi:hypothetical protein